ncbi:MAG TPA: hypothetical protein VFD36_29520 [Kofleriaceae bacterium]|nr:hypothetical protein [Kofleriaceae bacterium]
MGMTKQMIDAWIGAVLVPMAQQWVNKGVPVEQLGGVLVGYGVRILRSAGYTDARIRSDVFEVALTGKPDDPKTS